MLLQLVNPGLLTIFDPDDLAHRADGAQALHDVGEVDTVVDQHFQINIGELVVLVIGRDFFDVNTHAVDAGGDHGDHAAAVFDFDPQFY